MNLVMTDGHDMGLRSRRCVLKNKGIFRKKMIALLITTEFVCCIVLMKSLYNANNRILSLNGQIHEITQLNTELTEEKKTLQEKVILLSDTVILKTQREEEYKEEVQASYIPTGLPFSGTAFYNSQENELDGNPTATFYASDGITVTASANGTVRTVEGNLQSGFCVTVDHGNEYCSMYRSALKPIVAEGYEVTDRTVLFPVNEQNKELKYQITVDGKYIDPIELIESNG